jgi:serine/threonine protein kinase
MDKLTGSRLGPYEIGAVLGAGGMGEVYRAKDTRLKREVAVKLLSADFSNSDHQKRFQREAQAASALNHPNILVVHDIGSENGRNYIVSEFVEGETLRNLIQKGPLSNKKLLDLASQIADGLAAAHQAGIVHRDLKPENIMITPEGRIKILDFGLAKLVELETELTNAETITGPVTNTGIIKGTVPYMSPEQAKGGPIDFRSDQFALGSIVYEMATRKRPFQRETAAQTLSAIISEDPESISNLNPNVPAPVRWLIERCLAKDPQHRYDTTRDLYRDLKDLQNHLSQSAEIVTSVSSPKKQAGRFLHYAAAAVIVGLIAIATYFYMKSAKDDVLTYHRLTYREGFVRTAKFAPDGQTIVYSAAYQGNPIELFLTRTQGVDSRPLGIQNADVLSISRSGEMAILLRKNKNWFDEGVLAVVPLSGGAPREIAEHVWSACWTLEGSELAVTRRIADRTFVELPLGKVLYDTARFIGSLHISPDGNFIAFNEYLTPDSDLGSAVIIDRKGTKIASSSKKRWLNSTAWLNSRELWSSGYTNERGGGFELYSLSTSGKERIVQRFPNLILHDISTSGQALLNFTEFRHLTVASLNGDDQDRDLSWLDGTRIEDISEDSKIILFTEELEGSDVGSAYLRKTDGSPAILLGSGVGRNFSHDGKFVLISQAFRSRIVLMPTTAGETKIFDIDQYKDETTFPAPILFPDGKKILFIGKEKGHNTRVYIQNVSNGKPRAITKEGVVCFPNTISPDGKSFIGKGNDGKIYIYPIEGGAPIGLAGITSEENPIRWSEDGKSIFVFSPKSLPVDIYRLNPLNGKRELIKRWNLPYPTGRLIYVRMTPDGKNFAFSYNLIRSTLYQVSGIK